MGYTRVHTFTGGIPEWRKFNYPMIVAPDYQKIPVVKLSPEKVNVLIREGDVFLLDVRPLDFERETAFIPGARLCPLVYLAERHGDLPRSRKIIITDWAMKQSPSAAKFLIKMGYRVEGVLHGGMERWKAEHFPFENREPSGKVELQAR
jgi:rhodanese-related sulfurtransferase